MTLPESQPAPFPAETVEIAASETGVLRIDLNAIAGNWRALARRVAPNNVTINHLLPGPFDTDRVRGNWEVVAKGGGADVAELERRAVAGIPAGRLGTAEEFGAFAAFFCSAHAGFTTGQSILLDGGSYPGTL